MHMSDRAARLRATSWPYAFAAAAAISLIAYLLILGRGYGLDLKVYRDSVISWESGKNPYIGTVAHTGLSFTYPPFALLGLSPLAWASFPVTQWLLWTGSVAAAPGAIVLVLREMGCMVTRRLVCIAFAWSCVSVFVLEPARSEMNYGQIEFILMFIVVADLLLVPPPYRGIAIGFAAAVKLTPLVFIVVLAVSRDVKSVIRATASFLAWTGLSWLFWPQLSRTYWFHDVSDPGRMGTVTYGGNQSWYAILHRPPFLANGSELVWLLLALVIMAVSMFIAWRCVSTNQKAPAIVAIALAGLLISPISWTHHWIWVLLIPALLVCQRRSAIGRPVRMMLWGLLALTIAQPYWWFSYAAPADVFEAVLPVWASAALVVWAVAAFVTWRKDPALSPLRETAPRVTYHVLASFSAPSPMGR